jgi:hypothetical protein
LEIERQNTDSKFRDSSFCLRSCTHASPTSCDNSPDPSFPTSFDLRVTNAACRACARAATGLGWMA